MNLWSILQKIHGDLKCRFTYIDDRQRYGQKEYWARPSESFERDNRIYGDCEDFALACQEACEAKGIKDSRLIVCKTENGGHHCVLEVQGFILDNRQDEVLGREMLAYQWIKMQDHDGTWREIES